MTSDPQIVLGLLVLSAILTLLANWLVYGRRRPSAPRSFSSYDVLAVGSSMLWITLLLFAGIVASRYIERIDHPTIGYLSFGLAAGFLSWIRAILFHRIKSQRSHDAVSASRQGLDGIVRITNYFLFAVAVYMLAAWALQQPVKPLLFIPLCLGALIPDLDSPASLAGRLLPAVSRKLQARFGQQQVWHSLAVNALVAAITSPLIVLLGAESWALLSLGFLSHLLLDLFTPQGSMLFWPFNRSRYPLAGRLEPVQDLPRSRKLLVALGILCAVLLLTVNIGPQATTPAPSPTYEQTLQRYYSLRGSNLVYANIEGTWQNSGRRTNGTFEILNAAGDSYIMLDRYTGDVFTAGRSADDNLYLNRITLRTGSPARIKPVELHLQNQPIADGLPVLYEMQEELGLQHIYISGDIVTSLAQHRDLPSLQQDYAQTRLRHVQAHEPGHFSLHYLTASDLIALARLPVQTADLVVVATYAVPASGPTVTPLPPP